MAFTVKCKQTIVHLIRIRFLQRAWIVLLAGVSIWGILPHFEGRFGTLKHIPVTIFFLTVNPDSLDGPNSILFATGLRILKLLPHDLPIELIFVWNFWSGMANWRLVSVSALQFFLAWRVRGRSPEEILGKQFVWDLYFDRSRAFRGYDLRIVSLH